MNVHLVIGEFRSRDTAQRAIEELGRHGFLKTSIYQIGKTSVEGIDTMKNAYAGELPMFGRGVKGSDVAIEGRTNEKNLLYSEEDARKIMGGEIDEPSAYAVAVDITDHHDPEFVKKVLQHYGGDIKNHTELEYDTTHHSLL